MTQDVRLSEHFMLSEFTASQTASRLGIDNTPPAPIIDALRKTAELLEKCRRTLGGKPIHISSGYRSPRLNREVGGADNSAHLYGQAADFTCPEFGDPRAVCEAISTSNSLIEYDQLILEYGTWTHIAWSPRPRMMVLTIDRNGTRQGLG
jgi:hypothetical protein